MSCEAWNGSTWWIVLLVAQVPGSLRASGRCVEWSSGPHGSLDVVALWVPRPSGFRCPLGPWSFGPMDLRSISGPHGLSEVSGSLGLLSPVLHWVLLSFAFLLGP